MRCALALLAFAALPAYGQVVIGGGVYGYAPFASAPYGPLPYGAFGLVPYGAYAPPGIADPWAAAVPPRLAERSPACSRYGRCSPAEVAAYRDRAERLERLAPSAPADPFTAPRYGPSALPPPTAAEDIRPAYRDSSVVREAYRQSGRPLDARK